MTEEQNANNQNSGDQSDSGDSDDVQNETEVVEAAEDTQAAGSDKQLAAAQALATENHEKHLRALAEFENFKRRTVKERSELLKYQGEPLIVELLNVFDNLELALQHKTADADNLRTGLEMTYKGFLDALKKFEIRPESLIGKAFDPNAAAAISKVPSSEEAPAGTVVGELKKPFYYKDKLIRFGEAVVAVDPN